MKKLILVLSSILIYSGCTQAPGTKNSPIRDGFYQVMRLGVDSTHFGPLAANELVIDFDTLSKPGEFTKVVIDTRDFVQLGLETAPVTVQQTEHKKLLSITLTPEAAKKTRTFTAARVMKQVVIVLDGKAITMQKIREAITGPQMEITGCDDNACEYLYKKMKDKVKK